MPLLINLQLSTFTFLFLLPSSIRLTLIFPLSIAETGWPTASLTAVNCTIGGSVCGGKFSQRSQESSTGANLPFIVSESTEYLATYPCTANTNGTSK